LQRFYDTFVPGNWPLGCVVMTTLMAASFLLWVAGPAVNSASEVRAGAIGLGVIAAVWACAAVTINLVWGTDGIPLALTACFAAFPGGIVPAVAVAHGFTTTSVTLFLLTHGALAWCFVTRFGREVDLVGLSRRDATAKDRTGAEWLNAPRSSPFRALVWKQMRQGVPVAIAGAGGALCVTAVALAGDRDFDRSLADLSQALAGIGAATMGSFMLLGCCAGLLAGAGSVVTELEPRLGTFWRSRPISIDLWYWTALLSGLGLLLLVFGIPSFAGAQLVLSLSKVQLPIDPIVLLVASYVAGAFAAAIVRNAVYASVLGLGVLGVVLARFVPPFASFHEHVDPAVLVVSALLATLAWLAVRTDRALLR
jgi:hypothetical protein